MYLNQTLGKTKSTPGKTNKGPLYLHAYIQPIPYTNFTNLTLCFFFKVGQ